MNSVRNRSQHHVVRVLLFRLFSRHQKHLNGEEGNPVTCIGKLLKFYFYSELKSLNNDTVINSLSEYITLSNLVAKRTECQRQLSGKGNLL